MDDTLSETISPESLEFTTDHGASRSFWLALALVGVLVGWMGSGLVFPNEEEQLAVERPEVLPVAVAVTPSKAKRVTQFFQAEGQALPDRDTAIRSETSGQIADVFVKKGQNVEAGAAIARFETAEREAEVSRARAQLQIAQRDFDNALALRERGVATADRVAQTEAALASARAQFTSAEEALSNTIITAPFAGRVEALGLDSGEFIPAGSDVGRIVDNSPLTVTFQVPQQALRQLENGHLARVLFITGERRSGTVTFVGTTAARDTRTFLAEIAIPNEGGLIPAGISAEIQIPVAEVEAHFVSPATVSLDPDGALGVKVVDDQSTVQFYPIEIVRSQIEGIWVSGLPETAQIITVGQGYVSAGDAVRARPDPASQVAVQ